MFPRKIASINGSVALGFLKQGGNLFRRRDAIERFEREFAAFADLPHAIAVSSGRLGLFLVLEALRLGKKKVLLPAYNFHIVPKIVEAAGLIPVYVDVDPSRFVVTPELIEEAMADDIGAVIVTHLFGCPCDVEEIAKICQGRGVALIEDCAHAIGATLNGRHVGSFGDAAIFSFETIKQVNTLGGGMVTARDEKVAARIRSSLEQLPAMPGINLVKKTGFLAVEWLLSSPAIFGGVVAPLLRHKRRQGDNAASLVSRYKSFKRSNGQFFWGYTESQALLGLAQLEHLDKQLETRRIHAQWLDDILGDSEAAGCLQRQTSLPNSVPSRYLYCMKVPDPASFIRRLFELGVDAADGVMDFCPDILGMSAMPCPESQRLADSLVQIPFHPNLRLQDVRIIGEAVRDAAKGRVM